MLAHLSKLPGLQSINKNLPGSAACYYALKSLKSGFE